MLPRLLLLLCSLLLLPLYGGVVPKGTDLSGLNKGTKLAKNYRERTFSAYLPLNELERIMKIGTSYSSFDNPTGIYYKEGEKLRITLHDEPDGDISFVIINFFPDGGHEIYPLKAGDNDIVSKRRGLGYVDYRSIKGCKAKPVRMSLRGGTINGIFTRHDDNSIWKSLLARESPAGVLDMIGERCQIIYPVEALRKGSKGKGVELLKLYDRIVGIQQRLMGWDQEGIHPGNRIMCRVIWNGYMQQDGLGAAIHNDLLVDHSSSDYLHTCLWGLVHEVGHVNQMPNFTWSGMGEVSNNVFSMWCHYVIVDGYDDMAHGAPPIHKGDDKRGIGMDNYVNAAIVKKQLWQFQNDPEGQIEGVPGDEPGEVGVALCPLWQLQLYFRVARGMDDFYPTIFKKMRAFDASKATQGELRVKFCEYVSEASQLNMGEFLVRTGMLALMNRLVRDYGTHIVTINESMVRDALVKASKYPEPDSSVIYYINTNNVDIYRRKLALIPTKFRPEIPREGGTIVFPAREWKNAVAFEVYEDKKLVRVCLRGLTQDDNASTSVICPEGATTIMAVQWDGRRAHVSGKKLPPGSIPGNRRPGGTAPASDDTDDAAADSEEDEE